MQENNVNNQNIKEDLSENKNASENVEELDMKIHLKLQDLKELTQVDKLWITIQN